MQNVFIDAETIRPIHIIGRIFKNVALVYRPRISQLI